MEKRKIPEMWDGRAAERIIAHLEAIFYEKEEIYDI